MLSGAGLSTESGIPDYRGPNARRVTPMTYQAFVGDPSARRRYWARSYVGWRTFVGARPNVGHLAIRQLQASGLVEGVITQNVDGLHGSAGVIELHGNLARVICLDCGDVSAREALDARLREANPVFDALPSVINPDGDVTLADDEVRRFHMVGCVVCGGTLKPDVVFFGETVPRERVQASFALVERSRLLLVLGSSLHVMSGRRFVLRAAKLGIPVAIINQGATRGDHCASIIIDAPLGAVLPTLAGAVDRAGSLHISS